MTEKHTPGPWKAEPMADGDWRVTCDAARQVGHYWLANIYRDNGSAEQVAADAHLIAAAPGLLAALKALANALQMPAGPRGIMDLVPAALARARAAIAKAEGR